MIIKWAVSKTEAAHFSMLNAEKQSYKRRNFINVHFVWGKPMCLYVDYLTFNSVIQNKIPTVQNIFKNMLKLFIDFIGSIFIVEF